VFSVEAEWAAFDAQGGTMASGKESMGGQGDGITWTTFARILAHFAPGSRIDWSVTAKNTLLQTKTESAPTFVFGEGCSER
jgi:hypothetical protein